MRVLLMCLFLFAFAIGQTEIPDKLKVDIQREQLIQARAINEFNDLGQQIQTMQKRQAELRDQFQVSTKRLQELTKSICGNESKSQLNLDSLKCEPVPSPTPKK